MVIELEDETYVLNSLEGHIPSQSPRKKGESFNRPLVPEVYIHIQGDILLPCIILFGENFDLQNYEWGISGARANNRQGHN